MPLQIKDATSYFDYLHLWRWENVKCMLYQQFYLQLYSCVLMITHWQETLWVKISICKHLESINSCALHFFEYKISWKFVDMPLTFSPTFNIAWILHKKLQIYSYTIAPTNNEFLFTLKIHPKFFEPLILIFNHFTIKKSFLSKTL